MQHDRLHARLTRMCVSLVLCWLFVGVAQAAGTSQVPVAYGGRIVGDADRMRLVLDFDRPVRHTLRFAGAPRRMDVQLSPVMFKLPKRMKSTRSKLVAGVRFGPGGGGKARFTIDLSAPVTVARQSFVTLGPRRHRLVIDLRRGDQRDFAALVRRTNALTRPDADGNRTVFSRRHTVVLDPGHGGIDGGAKGRGRTVEKTITLSFARALKAALEAAGPFDVEMTRDADTFVPLSRRLALTRRAKAGLMISIHADSLRQRRIRGATVYTLNAEGSDALARGLADQQNRADLMAGITTPRLDNEAGDILFDLMHRETRAFSTRFAALAVAHLRKATRLIGNPHRSADFYVLKAPEVPSVLLELGYLSNREDEKLMRSDAWQQKTAAAMAQAVAAFFRSLERRHAATR